MTALDVDPDRAARVAEALQEGALIVEQGQSGAYRIRSFSRDSEAFYRVQLGADPSCTCPDAAYNGTSRCKHVIAAVLVEGLP